MNQKIFYSCFLLLLISLQTTVAQKRIITLSSALSETVHALGKGRNIVAVDVTSEYPAEIKNKPRASRDRTFTLEGLLAFKPDMILAPENEINYTIETRLKKLGIKVIIIKQEYSVKGAERFIKDVATAIGAPTEGTNLIKKFQADLKETLAKVNSKNKPKVLFIYARGAGVMSVAGKGSHINAIISLAGGQNVVQEFNAFKPYTTESLIKSNPDVLLLFDFGTSSLGGKAAILNMPGVSMTNAGKKRQVISMDGPLLVNFSTRLPEAIKALNQQLQSIK